MSIQVLIIEDEPEFVRRFSDAVLGAPDLQLIGAVLSGRAALAVLTTETPDVVLVDLGLPDMDGVDIVRHLAQAQPQADILVITMFADDDHITRSIEAGATGYLLKDTPVDRILEGIRDAREGGAPISPSIARKVLARFRALGERPVAASGTAATDTAHVATTMATTADGAPEGSPLTAREQEILRLVAKGFSFNEVSDQLQISTFTVVTHVKKIYRKLAVHSRGEAVFEAQQMGWL